MKKDIDLQEATMRAMLNETKLVEDDNELEWSSYSFDELNTVDKDYLEDAGDLASISKNLNDAGDLLVISLQYELGRFLLYANILDIDGEISDHPIDAVNVDITTEDNLKKDMNEFLNRVYSKLKSGNVYSDYFVENKIEEDVTPDREYQGIKYFDNQDGWCPVCNAHLHYEPVEYGGQNENGDSVSYCSWTCDKCGTRGEAYFKQSFIGHSVYDDNWDLIDLPFGEPKTESNNNDEVQSLKDDIWEYITDDVHHLEDFADYEINSEEDNDKAHEIAKANLNKFSLGELREIATEIASGSIDLVNWGHKVLESKKVEAIDKEKVLNMKYSDLPDMCYGLLPSDKSIIIIKKGENGYYETDFDDIEDTEEFVNRENSKMGVTPEQRMVMELRSMSGNWKLKNEESKQIKTESVEPEENKKLDLKDRVKYAYENCNYSKRKDMPTVSDIMDYLGLDTYNNKLYNQISDILYELGYDWKLESKQIKTEDEEAPVVVEYWETEADRDNGMGEIYKYYAENDIDNAIAVAKRILNKNNFASVEVWNTKTERSYYWSDGKDEKYFKV